jgi:adenylate cyclase
MARTEHAVLIVEDESIIAHDIQQILLEFGYDAYAIAATAEEALARASERRPDIAIVDIRIKGKLDGVKTAQLLQESHGVPIVYMTGHTDDATIQRAARTRPYGYLHKPVKAAELKSVIEIALYRRSVDGHRQGPEGPDPAAAGPLPTPEEVRRQLEQVLQSPDLDASRRSREFLGFIVEEALEGRGAALTQAAIATRVFGRRDDFEPQLDPIVRIQAGRLRRSLERYYLLAGKTDAVRIDIPRGSYVPVFSHARPGGAQSARNAPAVPTPPPAPAPPGDAIPWPSVAVRPFDVGASAGGVDEVALALQDELAMELGRYREVRVLRGRDAEALEPARQPRFEIAGRVRGEGEGWLVTARLVDRTTGEQIWSDQYHTSPTPGHWSGPPDDIARVIASHVSAEQGHIVRALWSEYRKRPAAAAGAYAAILRSHQFFFARNLQDLAPAVNALQEVVAEEPEIALAWMHLCRLYQVNYAFELSDLDSPIDQAVTYGYQGVRLDSTGTRIRSVLASALLIKGELEAALEELEQAVRLNPGSLVHLEIIGYLMALAGSWDRGIALVRGAMERNPHHMPHAYFGLWADHLRRGEFEPAYLAALEYRDPTFFWRALMRASSLGHLGRTSDACSEVAELLRQKPDFPARGRILIGRYIKQPELQERVVEGLRRAGLALA